MDRKVIGAPMRIRTSDLPLRRRLLYPSELPGRSNYCSGNQRWAPLASVHRTEGMARAPAIIRVNGGAEEDRTPDLRIANAMLSQLSYRPFFTLEHTFEAQVARGPRSYFRTSVMAAGSFRRL